MRKRKKSIFLFMLPALIGGLILHGPIPRTTVYAEEEHWSVKEVLPENGLVGSCLVETLDGTDQTRRTYVKPSFDAVHAGSRTVTSLKAGNGTARVLGLALGNKSLCNFRTAYSLISYQALIGANGESELVYRTAVEVEKGHDFTQKEYGIEGLIPEDKKGSLNIVDSSQTWTPGEEVTVFLAGTHTITFNANGGSSTPDPITVDHGQTISLPTPSRAEYIFEGWVDALGQPVTNATPICSDMTLTATWKEDFLTLKLYGKLQAIDVNHRNITPTTELHCHPNDLIHVKCTETSETMTWKVLFLGQSQRITLSDAKDYYVKVPADAVGSGQFEGIYLTSSDPDTLLVCNLFGWASKIHLDSFVAGNP